MADEEGTPQESTQFRVGDRLVDGWGNEVEEEAADIPDNKDYGSWKGDQLIAEVKRRNDSRDDEAKIVPDGKKKADFVAALEADDEDHDANAE